MPAGRFLLAELLLAPGADVALPPDIAHQTRDVLRLGVGDAIRLLDGQGGEYPAEVVELTRKRVVVRLGPREEGAGEHRARVVLCQGMLKAARFEWVLQKCAELGVAAVVPLLTERAVAAAEATGEAKRQRWRRILAEAVEQCGASRLPELEHPRPLMRALASAPPAAIALIPWEEETATPLMPAVREAISAAGGADCVPEVRLFIGPEGGFSTGEVALARRHGARPVTLGPRILRAETAAVVAVTLTLASLGALDVPPQR